MKLSCERMAEIIEVGFGTIGLTCSINLEAVLQDVLNDLKDFGSTGSNAVFLWVF